MAAYVRNFEFDGRTIPTKYESWRHYKELMAALDDDPDIERVPVQRPATNVGFTEYWF